MKAFHQISFFTMFISSYFIGGCTASIKGGSPEGPTNTAKAGLERPKTEIVISGNVGLPGVLLKGLPGNPISNAQGYYQVVVEPNWCGEATPALEGYQFRPYTRRYGKVTSSTVKQDYLSAKLVFPISGSVGLEGVTMKGLPGDPITGADGCYRALVEHGWGGAVTPALNGFTFDPPSRKYDSVTKEWIHENYTARRPFNNIAQDIHEVPPTSQASAPLPQQSPFVHGLVDAAAVLVLIGDRPGTGERNEIEEDLHVMSSILQKTVDGPPSVEGVFSTSSNVSSLPTPTVQAIYIQDYGVVFSVQVQSPLPLSDQIIPQPDSDPNRPRDSVWEKARLEIMSTPSYPDPAPAHMASVVLDPRFHAKLVGSLKHASNIRHLGHESWVTIHLAGKDHELDPSISGAWQWGARREPEATLRVRKGHIDSFAGGAMDERQFQQHVQVLVQ